MATKKTPAKKSPAKQAPAKKSTARKAPAKQAPAKKSTAKKSTARKAPAKQAPAKKSTAKQAPAKKSTAKQAPAKKSMAKQAPAKKTPAKKSPAKQAAAKSTLPPRGPGLSRPAPARKASAKPYEGAFVEEQRARLLVERADHLEQAAHLRAEADSLVRNREPGDTQFDDEGGEGDSIAVERDFDLHLARQSLATVEEIDAALDRIERNVYGICEVSGQRIPKERLQAIPWARERVEFRGSRLR